VDILFAAVDGLTGFPNAIAAVFPKIEVQLCIVHMVRSSLRFVPYKDPLPPWIQIMSVKDAAKTKSFSTFLGLGESSTIALALEVEGALVILDDKNVRRYAQSIGLAFTGIVGVLSQAYRMGLIEDVGEIVARLRTVDFRLPQDAEGLIRGEWCNPMT
jgi:predicted nucleic acid-binding protein